MYSACEIKENTKISYNNALVKCDEMINKYGYDNIFLELNNGKAYIVFYTLLKHMILYEIKINDYEQLSKMIVDFDESNIKILINN